MKKLSNTEAELKNNVSFKTKRVVSFIFSDLFYWNSFSKKKKNWDQKIYGGIKIICILNMQLIMFLYFWNKSDVSFNLPQKYSCGTSLFKLQKTIFWNLLAKNHKKKVSPKFDLQKF